MKVLVDVNSNKLTLKHRYQLYKNKSHQLRAGLRTTLQFPPSLKRHPLRSRPTQTALPDATAGQATAGPLSRGLQPGRQPPGDPTAARRLVLSPEREWEQRCPLHSSATALRRACSGRGLLYSLLPQQSPSWMEPQCPTRAL